MTSDLTFRPVTSADLPAFFTAFGVSFGFSVQPGDAAGWEDFLELDRTLGVFDGEQVVATSGTLTFELTVPGGVTIPAGGVTVVSVLPTHRRRGILREIMRREMEDFQQRNEPVALLYASESVIYGRFGYGMALTAASYEIDRHHGTLRAAVETPGSMRLIDAETAVTLLPPFYESMRRRVPGFLNRDERWWKRWMADPEFQRRGASGHFCAIYEHEELQGYLTYRVKNEWREGHARNEMHVEDLIASTPGAYIALWQYCMRADLIEKVIFFDRPLDEPIRWMLADPRRLRYRTVLDRLWARLVDVPAALEGRRYLSQGSITFRVSDPFLPENDGTYRLEGGPDGAACRRTDASPDLSLGVEDLGAIYLGGCTLRTLTHAGRVEELTPGAIHRADALFATERQPWCLNNF